MASIFPNGSTFAISGALETAKTLTAISNATAGVGSSAAHSYANGDILVPFVPGRLDGRVVRAANIAAGTFELEGINTTSTTLYPSGFGVGTVKRAGTALTGFTSFSQTTGLSSSGGEQQFATWSYVEDGKQRRRPTTKNARGLAFDFDYDPDLAWHSALLEADLLGDVRVLRVALPTGAKLFYSVYVSFDGQPSFELDKNMGVRAEFSLVCQDITRYAS